MPENPKIVISPITVHEKIVTVELLENGIVYDPTFSFSSYLCMIEPEDIDYMEYIKAIKISLEKMECDCNELQNNKCEKCEINSWLSNAESSGYFEKSEE